MCTCANRHLFCFCKAASLGIDPLAEPAAAYPYRGRGRGRGRSFFRGAARGGPPRASMKLDNRPKKLLIKDVGSDGVQAVRDWYEAGGQVDAVETLENGDAVVTFRTRAAAEQVRVASPNCYVVYMTLFVLGSCQRDKYPTWPEANQLVSWPVDANVNVGRWRDDSTFQDHT